MTQTTTQTTRTPQTMRLPYVLPNGTTTDLLGNTDGTMRVICRKSKQFKSHLCDLIEFYRHENRNKQRNHLKDLLRDQAYYYAAQVGDFDEEGKEFVSHIDLAEDIYNTLLFYAER